MAGKTLTRADLAEAVYQKGIVTKDHAAELVGQVLGTICTALAEGENVKLSSFGVLTLRDKAQRMGRNPKNGVEVPIEPRRVILFTASPILKAKLNHTAPQRRRASRQVLRSANEQHEAAS
ncbi:integration host factor subunit alpha [Microvirga lotononidis]|uniref:Integration host factor subunit alpha n=1 Tax=Microvirga lotononidis TaxID=864069 RepID=I4Z4D2_9HYPH|nr:integration host factor subunit alpha [Microvirga lotononidis]EIM31074.1 bacterial nucleoid DNA-binding protein [Microvirga lotononidis]WQO30522.1 integration host factor subunit alpha [Microvirga lotononidis]